MSRQLKNYDPAQVSVLFGGHSITGFADGTFVSVDQNEDSFALMVGSDGESARAKSNNQSGRVTVTLLQSSESNDVLSAFQNADRLGGGGVNVLQVKDSSGRTVVLASTAYIVKPAVSEFAREVSTREWIFESNSIVHHIGGNLVAS